MNNAACTSASIRGLDLVVWLHTDVDPDASEWAHGVETTRALKRAVGSDVTRFRSFVVTDGGAPNAAQRKELFGLFDERPHKLAVVTNCLTNPIKRGVATAISWLNPAFVALPTARLPEALRHVDLEGALVELMPHLRLLQLGLPPVKTLAEIERVVAKAAAVGRAP